METLRWAGLNLILLFAAGSVLTFVGAWRQELSVRETLARLLYGGQETQTLGPPQLSRSRQLTLFLGILGAGAALALFLLPLNRIAAALGGVGVIAAGLLLSRRLSGSREKQAAAEDVLPLVAHLRQSLGRGATIPEALHAFAREVEPGRALARRVESCLGAVEMGVDLHQAFDAWVARDDKHLQALASLLREVKRSREPQATLDRLTRKIVADLRQEMRFQVKRQALMSIVVTVVGLFPPLMLALLEPAACRLAQSILFGVGGAQLGGG
jgi:hypothetical protein